MTNDDNRIKRLKALKKQALNDLLAVAPQGKYLADMLGLQAYEVTDWRRKGAVSRRAALLVSESIILGPFFDRYILRPDLSDKDWAAIDRHFKTAECRGKMRAYEQSILHARSAVGLWMSRAQTLEYQMTHQDDDLDAVADI